ncbi:MAG: WD40/YVTN/BNR-like repeat-containing protein [Acidimicrobiales bacterium]
MARQWRFSVTRTCVVLPAVALVLAACSSSHVAASSHASTTTTAAAGTSTTAAPTTTTTTTTPSGPPGGPVPAGFEAQSVTFVSAQEGYVLGATGCAAASCTAVLRTRDGGRTWAGIPAPALGVGSSTGDADEIRFADPTDGWVFGHRVLQSTHDGGSHWSAVPLPGGGSIQSLAAGGGFVYALVIQGNGANPAPASLYRTPAGTDSWSVIAGTTVANAVTGVVVVHGSAIWTVVQTAAGASVFRAFSGGSWVTRSLPCQGPSGQALAAVNTQDMAVVCASGAAAGQQPKLVYSSANAGSSWKAVGSAPQGGDTLGLAMASTSTLVVSAASGASELYGSFDGGKAWTTVEQDTSGGGLPWEDLGFTDAAQGVVVEGQVGLTGASTHLYMTRDGGHSWAPVRFSP